MVNEQTIQSQKKLRMPKIPALDGVRGVMVIAVTFYHGGMPSTGGFYLSLDGFFVLSGYLITTLLLMDERKLGTVDFAKFWSRRARRLLPALFVLVSVILVFNVIWGNPANLPTIRGDALAALFYSSNWYYIVIHSGYFGTQVTVSPLQHTWSLAIEEQFYLLWPLIVYALLWFKKSLWPILIFTVSGIVLSAIDQSIVFNHAMGINHAYYGTDARAQALLTGCALAIVLAKFKVGSTKRSKTVVNGLALTSVLVMCLMWFNASGPAHWAFHGAFTGTDICVALIILATVVIPKGVASKILSVWVFRKAGEISYGWYLWQFPIDQVLTSSKVGVSGMLLFLVRSAAGIGAATISFYLIEQPVRSGKFIKKWRSYVLTPVVAILVSIFAVLVGNMAPAFSVTNYLPSNLAPVSEQLVENPMKVLLVGDSLAYTLGIGMGDSAKYYGDVLFNGGQLGCGVLTGGLINDRGVIGPQAGSFSQCLSWPQIYTTYMSSDQPDVSVLLVGRWECLDRNWGNGWEHIGESDFDKRLIKALNKAITILSANKTPVVLLTAPYFDQGVQANGQPWPEDTPSRVNAFNAILRQVASSWGIKVTVLDLNQEVDPNGYFTPTINNVPIRNSDGVHFVESGGIYVSNWLYPLLNGIGFNSPLWQKSGLNQLGSIPPISIGN